MSVDRAIEGWEGFQRHGQDIALRFTSIVQELGFLLQSHLRSSVDGSYIPAGSPFTLPFPDAQNCHQTWQWPWIVKKRPTRRSSFNRVQFNVNRIHVKTEPADDATVSSSNPMMNGIHEFGQRIGQTGAELCGSVAGFLSDFGKHLSLPFQGASEHDEFNQSAHQSREYEEDIGSLNWRGARNGYRQWKQRWHRNDGDDSQWRQENDRLDDVSDDELIALFTKHQGLYRQGSINVTTTYDSRTQGIGSSVTARGDLWRVEASSHSGSQPAYGANPLFLLQIGPILFVRDSTLLLPIHLSKQHLLWYGYDRKNGVHSVCPAVWSKHRRWLLMSMICLNPLNCTFMDLQFPNGQVTYVAGEGLTSSLFFPLLGGFLQAQSHRPGATKLSFSKKMSWGSRVTPSIQFADKSFSVDVLQPLVWQRSGIMVRPAVELRITQTIGGRHGGWKAEVVHSPMEKISWSCGCALTIQPTVYASFSVGKSKRNGSDAGNAGLVLHVETPIENPQRASFFIRLNSCVEF